MAGPLPTPTGQATGASALVAASNGANWASVATTDATQARAVAIVTQAEGATTGANFNTWYTQARIQDPNITPDQATAVFLLGDGTTTGIAKATTFLTGGTATVSSGGGTPGTPGATPTVNLGTVASGTPGNLGLIQSITQAAENSTGIGIVLTIEQIWAGLGDWKMWRSLGWLVLGGLMILLGAVQWSGLSSKLPKIIPI
jgi:hypothetical protein